MPRIFAPKEDYTSTQNLINFVNGAAAVEETDTGAVAYYTALGCDIDYNKHELTALDKLPRDVLDEISLYIGATLVPADGKYDVIRKLEGAISITYLGSITPTSVAHATEQGKTTVTMAAAAGAGNTLYYKTGVTAPAPLYGDKVDSTWTAFTSPVSFTPTATHQHITTVEAVTATGFILKSGTDNLTVK